MGPGPGNGRVGGGQYQYGARPGGAHQPSSIPQARYHPQSSRLTFYFHLFFCNKTLIDDLLLVVEMLVIHQQVHTMMAPIYRLIYLTMEMVVVV